jgi:hypothetical protein
MTKIFYERFSDRGGWEILKKDFETEKDARRFIYRIRQNIIVRRIWIK